MGRGRKPTARRSGVPPPRAEPASVAAVFGVTAGAATPAEVARAVGACAAADGELFYRRLAGSYVLAEPRFRLGLIPRSLTSVVKPVDVEELIFARFDELPSWGERDFARWLNGLVAARSGVHRRPGPGGSAAGGDDATAVALIAARAIDG